MYMYLMYSDIPFEIFLIFLQGSTATFFILLQIFKYFSMYLLRKVDLYSSNPCRSRINCVLLRIFAFKFVPGVALQFSFCFMYLYFLSLILVSQTVENCSFFSFLEKIMKISDDACVNIWQNSPVKPLGCGDFFFSILNYKFI